MNVSMAPMPAAPAMTTAAPAGAAAPAVGLAEAGGDRPTHEQTGDEQPDDFTAIIASVAQTVVAAVENATGSSGAPSVGAVAGGGAAVGAVTAVTAIGDGTESTAPHGWALGHGAAETALAGRGLGRAVVAEAALGRAQPTLPDAAAPALTGRATATPAAPNVAPVIDGEVVVPAGADVDADVDGDVDAEIEAIRVGAQRGRGGAPGSEVSAAARAAAPGSEVSAAARAAAPGSEVSAAARAASEQAGAEQGETVSEIARQAGARADLTANGVRRSAAETPPPVGPTPGTAGAAAHVPLVGPDGVEITAAPAGTGQAEVAAVAAAGAAEAARRAAPPPFVPGLAAGQRLTIDASDDTLGKLTITASTERGAVNLHLVAEEDRTRAALEQQQSELRDELESAGVPLGSLDVTDGGEMFERGDDDRSDDAGATRGTGDRPGHEATATPGTPAGLIDGHLDLHL